MAVIVVGGQTRGVGKTSVVCTLISALSDRGWTAVKISAHGHSETVEIREETVAGGEKDSARYLAAGAVRAFYVGVLEGGLEKAMPGLKEILRKAEDAIVESASVLEYLRPDLALAVVDPAALEVKESLQLMWEQFDAVITVGSGPLDRALEQLRSKPRFVVRTPNYGSEELNAFVREVLGKKPARP